MIDNPPETHFYLDTSVPDIEWWDGDYAEFEDFIGIGDERCKALVTALQDSGVDEIIINRLRRANGLPHGPCNTIEAAEKAKGGK